MIDFRKEVIGFNLANNTNSAYNVNITNGAGFPPQLSVNATTKFTYNVTGELFTCGSATIYINNTMYNVNYNLGSLQSCINSLNNLGFGKFDSYTNSGNTYIQVYDNVNIYGTLNICTVIPPNFKIFSYNNFYNSNSITLNVSINGNLIINPTLINGNSTGDFVPLIDISPYSNSVQIQYAIISGYQPINAELGFGGTYYYAIITPNLITFNNVNLLQTGYQNNILSLDVPI
jgi:hypothetical protein